ncbi:hypothetical protein KY363_08145, partial [Candidatus Woesearchaeota archaeon]|nr:hypothetical protein [Candidatus Woesearchaeota archaeon]
MAGSDDSKKGPRTLADRMVVRPQGEPRPDRPSPAPDQSPQAVAGQAMAIAITNLDRSKRLFDEKTAAAAKEEQRYLQMRGIYEERNSELDRREAELRRQTSEVEKRETAVGEREKKASALEERVKELEAQNSQARRGAAEVSGTITDPFVDLEKIRTAHSEEIAELTRKYEADILQAKIDVQAEIERKYTGPEGLLTLAITRIDELEKLLGPVPSIHTSDPLETTMHGMPTPVNPQDKEDLRLAQERPTKQPGAKAEEGIAIETIVVKQTPARFYEEIARLARETNVTDRKKRYSDLVTAMRDRGIKGEDAVRIVTRALEAEVLEEKVYENIVEEGKKLDRMIAYLRNEVEAFQAQKLRLAELEAKAASVNQQEADNSQLADALDKKEKALLEKQGEIKEMSEVITLAESAFKALNKGIEEMIVDCHHRVKDYKGRVASLVSGPRSIGATGAALILMPAYAGKLLMEPRDPDLVSMIADEKTPRMYFTAGDEGDAARANQFAGTVPENEVYHISTDNGRYYIAARIRT